MSVEVTGVHADEPVNEDEAYHRAVREWQHTKQHLVRRKNQVVRFHSAMGGLVFLSDQHLGDPNCDVPRVFAEAQIVRDTPGLWAVTHGDLINNFIIHQLRRVRDAARFSIGDEWALLRRYLRVLGPKLLAAVLGNHEGWVNLLTGIDYFHDTLARIRPDALYDPHQLDFKVVIGAHEWPVRVRHKWKGHSIYNPTHGIERAAKFDGGFVLGVGGHTHTGGYARSFNAGGVNGLAVMTGSYKVEGGFARRVGFAQPNRSTAVAVLFDADSGSMVGCDNLELAARLIAAARGGGE